MENITRDIRSIAAVLFFFSPAVPSRAVDFNAAPKGETRALPAPAPIPRTLAGSLELKTQDLAAGLPAGITLEDGQRLVSPGTVPQAAPGSASASPSVPQAPSLGEPIAPAQAGAPIADADVRGKTLLLVGTRGSRPFIIEEAVRVANELGLNLVLLDKEENRKNSESLVPETDFFSAPIDRRDDRSMKSIVAQVQQLASERKIDYVMAFRSHHAKLVGKIVDATGISGVPGKVALTAEDKARTRKALNAAPDQFVPYREVKTADEVREFYRQYGGSGKFVMKSKLGENSRFVELDIDSEEKLVSAFTKMDAALRAEARKKESSDTIFNRFPGIMVEKMLQKAPGTVEASVEMVVQNGKVKFAMVSDTHGIGPKGELAGGSMTFPSQMSEPVSQALIAASARALEIIGLRNGNARIDIMMTPDGPKVIEINPFLGGAAIYTAIKLVTGISLVEWGIRATLGLSLPGGPAHKTVVDYRFAASQHTGSIIALEGVEQAKALPGVAHVQLLAGRGDSVAAPIENGFEEWAEVMGTGPTFEAARRASIAALAKIKAVVVVDQTADYLQPKPEERK
ncbi:MAG: hypothetical protein HY077_06900 [Elusimicrobia bacterium]|nr:hypothetical protein [Elusimicrobiota bacterium]